MGKKLVPKQHLDDMLDSVIQNPANNPSHFTIDRLLSSAVQEEISLTFLFLKIFPMRELLMKCNDRRIKKLAKTLLYILLNNTPDDIYVDCTGFNEFLLLLPGVPAEEAQHAGIQIHQVFQSLTLESLKTSTVEAGIHGCVLLFPQDFSSRVDLLRRARETLFYVEQIGEHCITFPIVQEASKLQATINQFQEERISNLAKSEGLSHSALIQEALDDLIQKYKNLRLLRSTR